MHAAKMLEKPSEQRLAGALGPALKTWTQLESAMRSEFPPVKGHWKPSKLEFGGVYLLKQKERTLVYMLPGERQFEASIVLGERAVALAMGSDLPPGIKILIAEARPYVEGRGVRFPVRSEDDIATVLKLVRFKTAPR